MAVIALANTNKVNIATVGPVHQFTGVAAEVIPPGSPVITHTASGSLLLADANTALLKGCVGVTSRGGSIGAALTVVVKGLMEGWDFTAVGFGSSVFVSDTVGGLDTVTGSATVRVGVVLPIHSQALGGTPNKMLFVDCGVTTQPTT